jgi:hypothetical protein
MPNPLSVASRRSKALGCDVFHNVGRGAVPLLDRMTGRSIRLSRSLVNHKMIGAEK